MLFTKHKETFQVKNDVFFRVVKLTNFKNTQLFHNWNEQDLKLLSKGEKAKTLFQSKGTSSVFEMKLFKRDDEVACVCDMVCVGVEKHACLLLLNFITSPGIPSAECYGAY